MRRTALAILLALAASASTVNAAPGGWTSISGADDLAQAVFWEDYPGVTATGAAVVVDAAPDGSLQVDRYGPQLHTSGDFGLVGSLQAATPDLAAVALLDKPDDPQRRVEIGLEQGQVVLSVSDADSTNRQTFATSAPQGPLTFELSRQADALVLDVSGEEIARVADAGVFQSGTVWLGTHVATGNQLTLTSMSFEAPSTPGSAVHVDRCTPTRLLAAGTDASDTQAGMWWIWPDDGYVRQADPGTSGRSYLVDVSPDKRWMLYYQTPQSYDPANDRFVVDTWVMDLFDDQQVKLVDKSAPLGWVSDSSAVILGEQPTLMALVPSGQQVSSQGATLVYPGSMRAVLSPDGRLSAGVETTPDGAAGISILDAATHAEVMHIPTGRGAPQLAWSPDSSRLAFTSGTDTPAGLLWQLRMASLADKKVTLLDLTQDLHLHSVLWAPQLGGCV